MHMIMAGGADGNHVLRVMRLVDVPLLDVVDLNEDVRTARVRALPACVVDQEMLRP
jgi:hypothetical protein